MAIIQWIWNNIVCSTSIMIALLILIGQLISRKTVMESIAGALKGYIGVVVFSLATGGLGTVFRPIIEALTAKFAIDVAINDSYYGLAMMQARFEELGGNLGLSGLITGLVVLTLIALALLKKVTKIRTLMIQGHSIFFDATRCLVIVFCLYPTLPTWALVLFAVLLAALTEAVGSNLAVEAAQDLTGGANITVGHVQMIGNRIAWEIGRLIEKRSLKKTGKKPKGFEDLELPGWLSIFTDVYVSCYFVMFVFFGIIMLALGKETMMTIDPSLTESSSYGMYIFITAGKFPMYLVILFTGLRMFVAEIMAAFDGLNKRVLHGVLPGIDVAAFFGFAGNPNVVTMGFLSGSIIMILCTVIGLVCKLPFVVMMGFTQMMFDNAPMAMFGHKRGGIKGLFAGTALCAVVDTLVGGFVGWTLGYMPFSGFTFQFDWALELGIFAPVLKLGVGGLITMLVVLLLIPQLQYWLTKDKEDYFLVASDYQAYKEKQDAKENQK